MLRITSHLLVSPPVGVLSPGPAEEEQRSLKHGCRRNVPAAIREPRCLLLIRSIFQQHSAENYEGDFNGRFSA